NAFPTYGDAGWGTHDRLPTIQAMAHCLPEFAKDPLLGVDRAKSYLLKSSGFAIMRNGNERKSSYVNISFGAFAGWHSHWDLLSLNFWSQGAPLLEELCRFGPYSNPLDQMFRAPESHNLMLIDGMIYDSRLVAGRDVQWFSNEMIDYFSAYHRAYRFFVYGRDASPVSPNIEAKVRRTIVLVKDPGYVVVLDSVENINAPNFNDAISQYWHSPRPFRVVGPGRVRTEGNQACLLVYGQTESLHRLDTGIDFAGKEIAHLGHGYERYNLRARRWLPLNHLGISGFTTVLYPFTGRMPSVTLRSLPSTNGAPWKTEAIEVSGPHGRDRIVLNPECHKGFAVQGRPVTAQALAALGNRRGECLVNAQQVVP
ncbi:MAG: heparinase II/III family protein, partial [Lentisphaerae bacterium]|nr:heparinase II/III family protein [Lentisphaerota bacterium]